MCLIYHLANVHNFSCRTHMNLVVKLQGCCVCMAEQLSDSYQIDSPPAFR